MEIKVIEKETLDIVSQSKAIVITSNEDETVAVDFCKVVKNMQKQISETFDPIVERAHQAHKEATTQRNKFLDPLKEAEKYVKGLIGDYRMKLEMKRREEERKAREALEAQVKKEQEELLKKASEAQKQGNEDLADELASRAALTEAGGVLVASKAQKQDGLVIPMVWKARIVDVLLIPREFLIVNESALNAYAKTHGNSRPVAGVEFYEEPNVRIRG